MLPIAAIIKNATIIHQTKESNEKADPFFSH
jgi:hypothetical protein